jgi:DNA helicase IV
MADALDIGLEQEYFDRAWSEREGAAKAAAGPTKTMAEVKRASDRVLDSLGRSDEAVAFGRFDLADGSYYVGRHVISTEDRDLLVINWRVPAAQPFYMASHADPSGVILRRQFTTDRNTIIDFDEIVFADLARRVEEITAPERWGVDDAVLRDLDQDRTGEMRDIVQTIHAAQYGLIRFPLDQLLIIQGGPGTGKTAVALHRVSWLLYNHRDELSAEDVLVVGPNPTFTRYIRSVLPGLGDADVQHWDLRSLGPQSSHRRDEAVDVARLKGEVRIAALLVRALVQRVRFPERTEFLEIGSDRGAPRFSREDIEAALPRFLTAGTYNDGRARFRTWLTEEAERRLSARQNLSATGLDNAVERVWPSLTSQAFLRELLGSRERLLGAAADDFTAGDINRLLRPAAERISDERWSDTDVALLDEAETLINGRSAVFRHILVDEAQDLSPMQLRSIRRRSRSGSLTIVGDIAQSTGAWARDSWDDVREALQQEHPTTAEELSLGYRVPEQVYAFAVQLLPYAAPAVVPPRVVRKGPADPDLVKVESSDVAERAVAAARGFAGRGLFVGVICPDVFRAEVEEELRRNDVHWSDTSQGALGASINLARPSEAKGLEFDAVVVVEPEAIVAESERGHRMLYIALTRTTRYLSVIHSRRALPLPTDDDRAMLPSTEQPLLRTVEQPPDEADVPAVPAEAPFSKPILAGADLSDVVTRTVAEILAEQVRANVPESKWPLIVDRLRRQLGVTAEDLFDLFE